MTWGFDGYTPTFDSDVFTLDGFSSLSVGLAGAAFDTSSASGALFNSSSTGAGRMQPQYLFGPGVVWATQNTTASGAAVANPSPILVSVLQDLSIDMSAELKELYGSNAFAIAIGRGKQKMNFKLKNAQINGALWNSMFFGQSLASGVYTAFYDTTGTPVPSGETITPVTTYAAQLQGTSPAWGYDLGVRDVNNLPLQRVVGTPATRQYSVINGVYTFAAADVGITYYFSFNYTATSTTAKILTLNNVLMGYAPTFQLDFIIPYQGNVFSATFPNCMETKLGAQTKLDDFAYPEMDISAFAPGAAAIGTLSWSQ